MNKMEIINLNGLKIKTHPKVYIPAEDSELLYKNLKDVKNKTVLDIGTGSGIQALSAFKNGAKYVLGVDINPYAVKTAYDNLKLNFDIKITDKLNIRFIYGDLFNKISKSKIKKFDVIVFNAPYLPTSEDEKLEKYLNYAFDGGLDGRLVLDKFIDELPNYLKKGGVVKILQSSLTDEKKTISKLKSVGIIAEKIDIEKYPFEELQLISGTYAENRD
ncbi:release factor glutamine methyltransferase [Methanococcus voltae PS]|jgi:release factor glutamine methyltransferase|uniref:Release factor glutamine methyltransferase n=1 Tax=Methanococcus voltae PS TaxID=523842 RepID=A0ABT2EY78_METVO|nr:HemK2/MTQ2 family protein methyltransferase [Methanococcus voltae]MCS3922907.1 release factor glutamine methyltransferase [Methanococcus voltae PS]